MEHATENDLHHIPGLLGELRKLPQLRERKPGYFSLGSRAFLHFHKDGGDFYVDVKLQGAFQRMRISDGDEQAAFLRRVREELQSAP